MIRRRDQTPRPVPGPSGRHAPVDFGTGGQPPSLGSSLLSQSLSATSAPDALDPAAHSGYQAPPSVQDCGPPTSFLLLGTAVAILGIALGGFASGRLGLAIVGWLIGGLGGTSFVIAFTASDLQRRTSRWYVQRPYIDRARLAVLSLAAIAVVLNAWVMAEWAGRHL